MTPQSLESLQRLQRFARPALPVAHVGNQQPTWSVSCRFGTEQAMLLAWQKCFLELDPDAIYMFEVRSNQACHQCPACQPFDVLLMRFEHTCLSAWLAAVQRMLTLCDSFAQRNPLHGG